MRIAKLYDVLKSLIDTCIMNALSAEPSQQSHTKMIGNVHDFDRVNNKHERDGSPFKCGTFGQNFSNHINKN